MNDANSGDEYDRDYAQTLPPSPSRMEQEKDGYAIAFYPGFVAGVTVRREGQDDLVLYQQAKDDPFILPAGSVEPFITSEFDFRGGKLERHFRLIVTDPHHDIDSIVVTLRARTPSTGDAEGEVEQVVIQDNSVLCPPMCPPVDPGCGGNGGTGSGGTGNGGSRGGGNGNGGGGAGPGGDG